MMASLADSGVGFLNRQNGADHFERIGVLEYTPFAAAMPALAASAVLKPLEFSISDCELHGSCLETAQHDSATLDQINSILQKRRKPRRILLPRLPDCQSSSYNESQREHDNRAVRNKADVIKRTDASAGIRQMIAQHDCRVTIGPKSVRAQPSTYTGPLQSTPAQVLKMEAQTSDSTSTASSSSRLLSITRPLTDISNTPPSSPCSSRSNIQGKRGIPKADHSESKRKKRTFDSSSGSRSALRMLADQFSPNSTEDVSYWRKLLRAARQLHTCSPSEVMTLLAGIHQEILSQLVKEENGYLHYENSSAQSSLKFALKLGVLRLAWIYPTHDNAMNLMTSRQIRSCIRLVMIHLRRMFDLLSSPTHKHQKHDKDKAEETKTTEFPQDASMVTMADVQEVLQHLHGFLVILSEQGTAHIRDQSTVSDCSELALLGTRIAITSIETSNFRSDPTELVSIKHQLTTFIIPCQLIGMTCFASAESLRFPMLAELERLLLELDDYSSLRGSSTLHGPVNRILTMILHFIQSLGAATATPTPDTDLSIDLADCLAPYKTSVAHFVCAMLQCALIEPISKSAGKLKKDVLVDVQQDLLSLLYNPLFPAAELVLLQMTLVCNQILSDQKAGVQAKTLALTSIAQISESFSQIAAERDGHPHVDVESRALLEDLRCLLQCGQTDAVFHRGALMTYAALLDAAQNTDSACKVSLTEELRKEMQAGTSRSKVQSERDLQKQLEANLAYARSRTGLARQRPTTVHVLLSQSRHVAKSLRTRSVRTLTSIAILDPSVLSLKDVIHLASQGLEDESAAVRDSTLALVQSRLKYEPDGTIHFMRSILSRLHDVSTTVRKRALQTYSVAALRFNEQAKSSALIAIIKLANDEEPSIRTAVNEAVMSLLSVPEAPTRSRTSEEHTRFLYQAALHMTEATQTLFQSLCSTAAQVNKEHARAVARVLDLLLLQLHDGVESLALLRTLRIFAELQGSVIKPIDLQVLQNILKIPGLDEAIVCDILRIFSSQIGRSPRLNTVWPTLQLQLVGLISQIDCLSVLPEAVRCLCLCVQRITADYDETARIIMRAYSLLTSDQSTLDHQLIRKCCLLLGLISQHCNFDELRESGLSLLPLSTLEDESISAAIYEQLMDLAHASHDWKIEMLLSALAGLDFFLRGHPKFGVEPDMTKLIATSLSHENRDVRFLMLNLIHGYLDADAVRTEAEPSAQRPVDAFALGGDGPDVTANGVVSGFVQSLFGQLRECCLSSDLVIQVKATKALSSIVFGGHAHPIETLPLIVALETSSSDTTNKLAFDMHVWLKVKNPNLVYTRFAESVASSYKFQTSCRGTSLEGPPFKPLSALWAIMEAKQQHRNEVIHILLRPIERLSVKSVQDVAWFEFLLQNLADLLLTSSTELALIISSVNQKLATTGQSILQVLEETQGEELPSSVIVVAGILACVIALKEYLLTAYGTTEKSCLLRAKAQGARKDKGRSVERTPVARFDCSRLQSVRTADTSRMNEIVRWFLDSFGRQSYLFEQFESD